jgi:type 1 fimbria pilin
LGSSQLIYDAAGNMVGVRNRLRNSSGDSLRFDQSDGAAKVGYQPVDGEATDVQTALRALDAGTSAALSASGGSALVGYLPSGAVSQHTKRGAA